MTRSTGRMIIIGSLLLSLILVGITPALRAPGFSKTLLGELTSCSIVSQAYADDDQANPGNQGNHYGNDKDKPWKVPEPTTVSLLGLGLVSLALFKRRDKSNRKDIK